MEVMLLQGLNDVWVAKMWWGASYLDVSYGCYVCINKHGFSWKICACTMGECLCSHFAGSFTIFLKLKSGDFDSSFVVQKNPRAKLDKRLKRQPLSTTFELFIVMTLPTPFPLMITPSSFPMIVIGLFIMSLPLYVPEESFNVDPAGVLSIVSCSIFAYKEQIKVK